MWRGLAVGSVMLPRNTTISETQSCQASWCRYKHLRPIPHQPVSDFRSKSHPIWRHDEEEEYSCDCPRREPLLELVLERGTERAASGWRMTWCKSDLPVNGLSPYTERETEEAATDTTKAMLHLLMLLRLTVVSRSLWQAANGSGLCGRGR